jgi:transcriptional regulator with XRE-family HTH domain
MNNMDSMRDKNESAYTKICGQNIRRLREKEKYSREKLAELLECSSLSLGRAERGEQTMKFWRLIRLCKLFHVSLDDLFHDENADGPAPVPSYIVSLFRDADEVELEILSDHMISASREIGRYHSLEQTLKAFRSREESFRNREEVLRNMEKVFRDKEELLRNRETFWEEDTAFRQGRKETLPEE